MHQKVLTVINETGIHARPASAFIHKAAEFKSSIKVRNLSSNSAFVNAKSMIRVLSLELCQGMQMELSIEGEDENEAVAALTALVESGFGEV